MSLPLTTLPPSDEYLDAVFRGLTRRAEVVIAHRWDEWLPLVSLWAAKKRRPCSDLRVYQRRARNAALVALSRGLGWPTIRARGSTTRGTTTPTCCGGSSEAAQSRKSYARPQKRSRHARPKEHTMPTSRESVPNTALSRRRIEGSHPHALRPVTSPTFGDPLRPNLAFGRVGVHAFTISLHVDNAMQPEHSTFTASRRIATNVVSGNPVARRHRGGSAGVAVAGRRRHLANGGRQGRLPERRTRAPRPPRPRCRALRRRHAHR